MAKGTIYAAKPSDILTQAWKGASGVFSAVLLSNRQSTFSLVCCVLEKSSDATGTCLLVPCLCGVWGKCLVGILSVLRNLRSVFGIALCHRASHFGSLGAFNSLHFVLSWPWPELHIAKQTAFVCSFRFYGRPLFHQYRERSRRWSDVWRHLLNFLESAISRGHYLAAMKSYWLRRCPHLLHRACVVNIHVAPSITDDLSNSSSYIGHYPFAKWSGDVQSKFKILVMWNISILWSVPACCSSLTCTIPG